MSMLCTCFYFYQIILYPWHSITRVTVVTSDAMTTAQQRALAFEETAERHHGKQAGSRFVIRCWTRGTSVNHRFQSEYLISIYIEFIPLHRAKDSLPDTFQFVIILLHQNTPENYGRIWWDQVTVQQREQPIPGMKGRHPGWGRCYPGWPGQQRNTRYDGDNAAVPQAISRTTPRTIGTTWTLPRMTGRQPVEGESEMGSANTSTP